MPTINEKINNFHVPILFNIILFALFLTPHIPMPTGALGPLGPGMYLGLFLLVIVFILGFDKIPYSFQNKYFLLHLILALILIWWDFFNMFRGSFMKELNFILIRITNLGVFTIFSFSILESNKNNSFFLPKKAILKTYYFSIVALSLLLYLQAFEIITIGEVFRGRTYFGIQLPFKKPLGFFDLSDGKLGCMIVPAFFLSLVCSFKQLRFIDVPFPKTFSVLFFFLMIIVQSRSGYLGLFLSVLVFCFLIPYKFYRNLVVSSMILFAVFLYLSGLYKLIWLGLVGEGVYEQNVASRGQVIMNELVAFFDSPIIGRAHENSIIITHEGQGHTGSHNLFTNHLAVGGLMTFIPFIMMLLSFLYYALRNLIIFNRRKELMYSGFAIWCICSMAHITIELSFYRGLYNEYYYFMLAFGVVLYLNTKVKLKYG